MKIIFICHGNICRSPMAERVAQAMAGDRDWTIVSAGVSAEEAGHGIDFRAERQLAANGYRIGDHVAHRITAAEVLDADLVVAAERLRPAARGCRPS